MLAIADTCFAVVVTTAFAKDLTWPWPPAQDHEVDHATVVALSELTVVHCEPEVAEDSPHRLLYTVYVPVTTESHCPDIMVSKCL